ncbi:peptidoglycan D,D-transpeptidase FtsI family protein [Streptomyces montanisoli]|uniref:peptidoglycan D,D-transpeptidase FtsI family protein n=1 Tax=Streptomyces montanisoli TaxID=2798581 RepID=UPI0027DB6873|nr:penicillin-binding protein 2 [Streptomyces montanisoli]
MPSQEPPRRRVPGPARPSGGARPGPGARPRPAKRRTYRPGPPRTARRLTLGSPKPRLRFVAFAMSLVMLVFVVRLLQVQAVDATAYTAKADENRVLKSTIAAERGEITDRSGVSLAASDDAYDITADPSMFTPKFSKAPDTPERAAALLAPILGVDQAALVKKLKTPKSRYAMLAPRRTPQVWNQIKDLKNVLAAKASKDSAAGGPGTNPLAGVFEEESSKRVYPNGELAAGVLGFVNGAGKGAGGLESMLNKELAGKDGEISYTQSGGRRVPTGSSSEKPAVPGTDIELTLDRDIQWAAQKAIAAQVKKSKADRGYVVVQDARNGQVLAMADAPSFDPNDLSSANPADLGNAALQDAYEPGSVAKVMTMSAVLQEKAATALTHVVVPNRLHRGDRLFHDDIDHATEYLTLNGVLAKSSNIGTIEAAGHLGKTQAQADEVLYSYLTKFGIGQPTGLAFPGETRGLLAKPQDWSTSQQFTIPFGQGFSINALQAASVYSTIANGGVRVQPTLIKGTRGPDGRFTPGPAPRKSRVVSAKTAHTVGNMLESVVGNIEGTGNSAQIPGYRVAGKTGTANRVDPKTGGYRGYTASFAGFAPVDKPRVTVYCAIQNPTKGSYFGGSICGPIFKKVMEFSLKSLQVPPSGSKPAKLPVTFEPGSRD